jgi:hypothetical protein
MEIKKIEKIEEPPILKKEPEKSLDIDAYSENTDHTPEKQNTNFLNLKNQEKQEVLQEKKQEKKKLEPKHFDWQKLIDEIKSIPGK